jgi:hypothetical protein
LASKTFGPQFRPQDFKGPIARHYPDRDDLFQQLVGSALRELFLGRVSITSTKGRDGGIDVFVEASADSAELFYDLRFPIIVECKDHDDSLGAVTRNVEAGWSKVQEKLTRHAQAGWSGTYQPWRRTKGYLYCISAALHQQARDKLTQSIGDFFSSLPPDQRPPVEKVHVLDWSDLALFFNHHARLADAWLGTDLEGIVGYEAYAAGLSGFRLYLKEEKLPFISPTQSDPAHPGNLLVSLEQDDSSTGILIIGPGGVGKTRTCFEVARLADRKGWRVLHLLPGEPPVTASSLQEVVLQGCTPTLLIIDYLDQMGSLDFGTIRHRLFPEARDRGIRLALLANARPGLLHKSNPERDGLFQRIDLDIRDRRTRIAAQVQETIAPLASTILGPKRVRELCGTRPIIGMFIARELERYASEDKLHETVVSQLRHGDLQGWIRRRFEEDGLFPQETHPLLPASPDPIMIAAAAGFAAAPLTHPEMFQVISKTLAATGMPEATEKARPLISSLERSGWLEDTGYRLATPHDVIADELLELTLCDRELHTVRSGITDKILIGALAMPRVLGRFSVSLDRVIGQKDFPEQLLQRTKETVSAWLARQASGMGRVFTTADPDEVSYALGAVLTGAAWGDTALGVWDELIAPWLDLHARSPEARHLIYRGLKELPERTSDVLADMALRWLEVHSSILDATYVLAPLLARQDLGNHAEPAIKAAMAWLAEHSTEPKADFVLAPLLARQDLGDHAEPAIKAAMAWLAEHSTEPKADFVLAPLLACKDLGDQAEPAIKAAMAWLAEHSTEPKATYVLGPLLACKDLGDHAEPAIKAAMAWLAEHSTEPKADFVLAPLLARQDLGDHAEPAIKAALTWLADNDVDPEKQFVLPPLLARQDLGDQGEPAIKAALTWLAEHSRAVESQFVLHPLLARQDLGDQGEPVIKATMTWLEEHGMDPEAGFVFPPLLARQDLGNHAEPAVDAAMTWLEDYFSTQDAEFVLKNLLGKSRLSHERKKRCITLALNRLNKAIETDEASYLLRWCLNERTLSGQELEQAVAHALKYLRLHARSGQVDFVFKRLLRNPMLEDELWREVADYAFDWLRRTPLASDRDHALNSLFARSKCLTPEEKLFLMHDAQAWLQAFPNVKDKGRCIVNLKRLSDVDNNHNSSSEPADGGETQLSPALSDLLREHVRKGKLPEAAKLYQGLESVHTLLDRDRPGAAGYYLTSLLPLAALKNDPTYADQVIEAVRVLLGHPGLTAGQRKGFLQALYRSLDQGAWPDREEGKRVLSSLGIYPPAHD